MTITTITTKSIGITITITIINFNTIIKCYRNIFQPIINIFNILYLLFKLLWIYYIICLFNKICYYNIC